MIQLAYGVPGSGKSTLLHDLVKAQAGVQKFFVIDHEAGWGLDGYHWRGEPPSLGVYGPDDLTKLEEVPSDEWAQGVYVFRNVEPEEVLTLAVAKGNVVYVDDEIDLIGRRKGWDASPLRTFVHQGRHALNEDGEPRELHVLGACRRPQNLHTDLTDLVDQVYVFRCQGSRTLKRLLDDSLIEDAQWEDVRALPNFSFIHWPSGQLLSVPPLPERKPETPELTRGQEAAAALVTL